MSIIFSGSGSMSGNINAIGYQPPAFTMNVDVVDFTQTGNPVFTFGGADNTKVAVYLQTADGGPTTYDIDAYFGWQAARGLVPMALNLAMCASYKILSSSDNGTTLPPIMSTSGSSYSQLYILTRSDGLPVNNVTLTGSASNVIDPGWSATLTTPTVSNAASIAFLHYYSRSVSYTTANFTGTPTSVAVNNSLTTRQGSQYKLHSSAALPPQQSFSYGGASTYTDGGAIWFWLSIE